MSRSRSLAEVFGRAMDRAEAAKRERERQDSMRPRARAAISRYQSGHSTLEDLRDTLTLIVIEEDGP